MSTHRKVRTPAEKWGLSVALVGALVVVALAVVGFLLYRASRPPLMTVEGPFDRITVAGRAGSQPIVTVQDPLTVHVTKVRTDHRGSGRELTEGSPALLSITAFDGETGENLNSDGAPNLVLGMVGEEDFGASLADLLVGATEGSRLTVVRPLADGGTEIDVVDVLPTIATGAATPESDGPLTVEISDEGIGVTHESGDPPDGLTVQVLSQGTGAQVLEDDAVVIQYVAGNWGDGTIIGSTWTTGTPAMIDLNDAMPGVVNALVDQRIGSRLAVTIPAEMALGEDTLFVVVDILGAMPADYTEAAVDQIGSE